MQGKHKINMSVDNTAQLVGASHTKHISMQGLPYDKMKGLTPVSGKAGSLNASMKNGVQLQGLNEEE